MRESWPDRPFLPIKFETTNRSGGEGEGGETRNRGKKDKQYQIHAAGMFVLYVAREGYNNNIGTNANAGGVYSRHDGSRRKSWSSAASRDGEIALVISSSLAEGSSRRRGSASLSLSLSLPLPGSQPPHKVLVRAMRNVTEPTRPSSALLTIPSSLLPPLLLSRLPLYTAQLHLLLFLSLPSPPPPPPLFPLSPPSFLLS